MSTAMKEAANIHSCSPYCERPECIKAQRDELREAIAKKDAALLACVEALEAINKECFSHVDGRDLFAQMHPRNTLDIKRRVDARETWFEGDWLTDLWGQIKKSRAAIQQAEEARK